MIGIDIWGPATMTSNKKRYIIVASDYLTWYCEIAALSSVISSQVARFLIDNVFKTHGFVSKILSDRGTNFLSEVMQDLYDQLSIEKINTTHYQPQTDGLVESFNKTMGDMLSHYTSSDQKDWDRHLPLIQIAYNSSKSSATGYSPFYLVHGREPRIPLDITFEIPHSLSHYNLHTVIDHLAKARMIAKESIKRSQKNSKRYYDKHRRAVTFQVGDQVMRYVPTHKLGLTNKLLHKFTRPYCIAMDHGNNVFTLTPVSGRGRDVIANAESLKYFYDRLLYSFSDEESEGESGTSSDSSLRVQCVSTTPLPNAARSPSPSLTDSDLESAKSESIPLDSSSSKPSSHSAASITIPAPFSISSSTVTASEGSEGGDPSPPPIPPPEAPRPTADTDKRCHSSADDKHISQYPLSSAPNGSKFEIKELSQTKPVIITAAEAAAAVAALPQAPPRDTTATEERQPRRSTRTTARPIKYSKALFLPFALLLVAGCTTASFTKVAPLVWRVTDRPVISGVTRVHENCI